MFAVLRLARGSAGALPQTERRPRKRQRGRPADGAGSREPVRGPGESFFFEDLATALGEGRRGFGKLKRRERGWANEQVNIGIIEKQEKIGKFRENR